MNEGERDDGWELRENYEHREQKLNVIGVEWDMEILLQAHEIDSRPWIRFLYSPEVVCFSMAARHKYEPLSCLSISFRSQCDRHKVFCGNENIGDFYSFADSKPRSIGGELTLLERYENVAMRSSTNHCLSHYTCFVVGFVS